jgi:hypothetical protein
MAKILKTSPQGRKCMFPHCTHTLSIYNHDDYCHLHRDQMAQKQKPKILKVVPPVVEIHPVVDGLTEPLSN